MSCVSCPVPPTVPTHLPPPPQLWYPTRATLAQCREQAAWRGGTEVVGHQDKGPLRPQMPRNSSVRRLTQAGAAGDALDDVRSQALRRGEVCHGHACEGRTATSPCRRGCPQGTGRPVKLPWGTQAGPWQRHLSPARARRPPGARSGTWLGRPRRLRCKQRWACRGAEGCSPPGPPVGSGGTHRRPWQLERAAKERGCPRIRPW